MEFPTINKIAATSVMAGALSLAALGFGTGFAHATPSTDSGTSSSSASPSGGSTGSSGDDGSATIPGASSTTTPRIVPSASSEDKTVKSMHNFAAVIEDVKESLSPSRVEDTTLTTGQAKKLILAPSS